MHSIDLAIRLYLLFCIFVFGYGIFTAWEDIQIDPEAVDRITPLHVLSLMLFSVIPPFNIATLVVTYIYRQDGKP